MAQCDEEKKLGRMPDNSPSAASGCLPGMSAWPDLCRWDELALNSDPLASSQRFFATSLADHCRREVDAGFGGFGEVSLAPQSVGNNITSGFPQLRPWLTQIQSWTALRI